MYQYIYKLSTASKLALTLTFSIFAFTLFNIGVFTAQATEEAIEVPLTVPFDDTPECPEGYSGTFPECYLAEVEEYTIEGQKWHDVNGNGIREEDENGIEGWKFFATSESQVFEGTTDSTGYYYIDVGPGTWAVTEESKPNWTQTANNGYEDEEVSSVCYVSFGYEARYKARNCDFGNYYNKPSSNKSGGTRTNRNRSEGQVLGAATTCPLLINDFMKMDMPNNSFEVIKLQIFLSWIGINTPVTGVFDAATDTSVRAYQKSNQTDVLTPWLNAGVTTHEDPTGYVYKTTKWKINNTVCPGIEAFPELN